MTPTKTQRQLRGLGRELRRIRTEALGLSMRDVERRFKFDKSFLSRLEAGKDVQIGNVIGLLRRYGCELDIVKAGYGNLRS